MKKLDTVGSGGATSTNVIKNGNNEKSVQEYLSRKFINMAMCCLVSKQWLEKKLPQKEIYPVQDFMDINSEKILL